MVKYRKLKKYKYQLLEPYSIQVSIFYKENIETDFILLNPNGLLIIKKGYCWDGASGITIDTKSSMRGALVHDVLYQLMREGKIGEWHRKYADMLLRDICIEDGMYRWRAKMWYFCVRNFAAKYAKPKESK